VAAVQILYGLDSHGPDWPDEQGIAGVVAQHFALLDPQQAHGEARDLAGELVRGVADERQAIDRVLLRAAANWRLERMNRVDRNVLRLAIHELKSRQDVPPRVVLNEAIEIAKGFGSNESAAFVNGVLDRVRRDLGR
jgi:N utilization substance protein B